MTLNVFAQSWAEMMFEERRHDFGSVAIGVEAVYRFQLKNKYSDDVHIASVHSSCGCTTPSVTKAWIRGGETAEIVAKLNTDGRFEKNKSATLTVVFDKPYYAEVQLQVTAYIRPDVVITPGVAEFGSIAEGKKASTKLTMKYAGRNDWRLVRIERNNPAIHVRADEIEDEIERSKGRVSYDITITLQDNIRPGYVLDMIRFVTNDPNPEASSVMLPVHGYVTAPLIAKPSPLTIGILQPGETVTKNVVLRSATPFRIKRAVSDDKRFQFVFSEQENKVHVVPITFTAGENTGDLLEPIIVQTDLDAQHEIVILTQGRVLPEHMRNFPKEMIAAQPEKQNSEPQSFSSRQNDRVNNNPIADVPNIGRNSAVRGSQPLSKTNDQANDTLQPWNAAVTLPEQGIDQNAERSIKKLTPPTETNSNFSSHHDLEISFDSVSAFEPAVPQNNAAFDTQNDFHVDVPSEEAIDATTPLPLSPQDAAFETMSSQRMLQPKSLSPSEFQESTITPTQRQTAISDSLFESSSYESASIGKKSTQPQTLKFSTPTLNADLMETPPATEKFNTDVFTVVGAQKEQQSPAATSNSFATSAKGNNSNVPKITMVPPVPGMKPVPNSASSQSSQLRSTSQNSSPLAESHDKSVLMLQPAGNSTDLLASLTDDTPETPVVASQKNETPDTPRMFLQLPKLPQMPHSPSSPLHQEIPEDSLNQGSFILDDGYASTTKKEITEDEGTLQAVMASNGSSASQGMSMLPSVKILAQQDRSQKNDLPQQMPPATSPTTTATQNRPNVVPRITTAPQFGKPESRQQSTNQSTGTQSSSQQRSVLPQQSIRTSTGASQPGLVSPVPAWQNSASTL